MDLLLAIAFFAFGLGFLIKGADWLVGGASSVASVLKISPMVIGLTVVAFGTSAPELVVSVTSALSGKTEVTFGNIIGSNIANILLILGASAILCPLKVHKNTIWKEIPMSFLGAIVLTVLALQDLIDRGQILNIPFQSSQIIGSITASNGIILLSFFVIFIYYTFGIAKVAADSEPDIEKKSVSASVLFIIAGLIGLVVGSKLMVDNGIILAKSMGVSDSFIGLTLIAVGTSLPELITSLVAAAKKKVDIAVGNVVGSNIFNIFLVLGVTTLIKPLPLPAYHIVDILMLFGATILLFLSLFVRQRHILTRGEGSLMILTYVVYIGFLVVRG